LKVGKPGLHLFHSSRIRRRLNQPVGVPHGVVITFGESIVTDYPAKRPNKPSFYFR
jgi:hypothetical protein